MFKFKKGNTLSLVGEIEAMSLGLAVLDFTGWTGTCDISKGSQVFANPVFSWVDPAQRIAKLFLAANLTAGWPVGLVDISVTLTSPAGLVLSTQNQTIEIVI